MNSDPIDLTSCDTEPIHIIGSIQPNGALLAVDLDNLIITHFSENLSDFVGDLPPDPTKSKLFELVGETQCNQLLERQLDPVSPHLLRPAYLELPANESNSETVECLAHRNGRHLILELLNFEQNYSEIWQQDKLRQRIISDLLKPGSLQPLADASASVIREVTGFDRVMIYRFAEDLHGQVIAESTNRPDSFLGLHYPASDIPNPARRHFTLNLIRAIPDINAVPIPILTSGNERANADSTSPLDLTFSKLRAVAPVHIQYLRNMGVDASMSISLVSNDELWGLVACHHYSPHYVSSSRLRFCEMLGGTISALLQNVENTALLRRSIAAERTAFDLEAIARTNSDLEQLVDEFSEQLMSLVDAEGLVLCIGGNIADFGTLPKMKIDFSTLASQLDDGIALTDDLGKFTKLTADQISRASGAAYLELSEDGEDYLVLIREQYEHEVKWAGKPDKVETIETNGVKRLSPRGSFALWRQERLGRSKPFSLIDREVLRIIRRALFALNSLNRERAAVLAQRRAEADTTKMRLTLLDAARKSSMGELAGALAHELNQPLAAISNYVSACKQELHNSGIKIPNHVLENIEDAVNETSRAANLVRRLRSFISTGELSMETANIHQVIGQAAELALIASKTTCLAELRTDFDHQIQPLNIDPVQIGQVILNLVSNSINAIGERPGEIDLLTRLKGDIVEVSIRDSGPGIASELKSSLFDPFIGSTTGGMGMGLSLCRSVVEAHGGRIWHVQSETGTEIRFSLPVSSNK